MRNGTAFERPTSALHIAANVCSSWPSRLGEYLRTPDAYQGERGGTQDPDKRLAGGHAVSLADQVEHQLLPTPRVSSSNGPSDREIDAGDPKHRLETSVIVHLPTPRATRGGSTTEVSYALGGERTDDDRPQGEVLLPTPTTQPHTGNGPGRGVLAHEVLLPTPRQTDGPKGAAGAHARSAERLDEGRATLPEAIALLPTPLAAEGEKATSLSPEHRIATGHQVWLSNLVPTFLEPGLLPTPAARDHKDTGDFTPHPEKRKLAHTVIGEDIYNWGRYATAIHHAEEVAGRDAPAPTLPDGREGKHRLASRFVEWMMLLEEGRVTGHGLSRSQELARLGNGVVPLQAAAGVAVLISRLAADKRLDGGVTAGVSSVTADHTEVTR